MEPLIKNNLSPSIGYAKNTTSKQTVWICTSILWQVVKTTLQDAQHKEIFRIKVYFRQKSGIR